MCEEYVSKPLYLLIADWVMGQDCWISASEIARQFEITPCKAINIVSYILAAVEDIECETKTIPNKLEGRGCQCQRLVRVININPSLRDRLKSSPQSKERVCATQPTPIVPPGGLNREQKWQWMLSKSMRR